MGSHIWSGWNEMPKLKGDGVHGLEEKLLEDRPIEWQVVQAYVHTGSFAEVSRSLNIPISELKRMSRSVWWQEEVAAIRREAIAHQEALATRILDMTTESLIRALVEGERKVIGREKNGDPKVVMQPLKADTLVKISAEVFKQRQLLRNLPTAIAGDTNRINKLASKLRALGAQDPTLIEVEATEIVRDAPQA